MYIGIKCICSLENKQPDGVISSGSSCPSPLTSCHLLTYCFPVRQTRLKRPVPTPLPHTHTHHHHLSTPPPQREYLLHMQNNRLCAAPTVEGDASQRPVLPLPVLRHALVRPGVLLLEVGNLKDGVGILHFHLAGKGNATGSPPAYFWHRAEGRS